MKLSQLPVGALVKDPNTKYNNDVIIWQVLEHGHTGDPSGSTTLQSRDILTLKCFDAKEPSNSDNSRKQYGNNRYKYSNILQWLNSDKNSWYEAQHSADQEPSESYVWASSGTAINPYSSEAGFLTNFSDKLKKELLTVSKTTVLSTIDGGGSETVESKVFLTSTTEVGLANESSIAEGSVYSYYSSGGNNGRKKNLMNDAAKGDYTSATSPWDWWLRTPHASYSHYVRLVDTGGTLDSHYAYFGNYGVAPAFCISSDTEVSDTPDASNIYTLQFAPSCVKVYIGDENGEAKLIWEQEHEIEALVPTMTSDTTPSGVASASSVYNNQEASKAFNAFKDGDQWRASTNVAVGAVSSSGWIQYEFEHLVVIKGMYFQLLSTMAVTEYDLSISTDGVQFESIESGTSLDNDNYHNISNSKSCKFVRLTMKQRNNSDASRPLPRVDRLQFYGYKA